MTGIIEIFFDLAAGFPLAVLFLLGLAAALLLGLFSTVTLLGRGELVRAAIIGVLVAVVVCVGLQIIPGGRLLGPPAALLSAMTVFTTHARLARNSEAARNWDSPVAMVAGAAVVAMGLPLLWLSFSSLGG